MKIEILHQGLLIGTATVDASDPPMGVASGAFDPSQGYRTKCHAMDLEGKNNPAAADLEWEVRSTQGERIECQSVFIQDYADALGERKVSILGIPYPEYEVLFGSYPAFKAYWKKS